MIALDGILSPKHKYMFGICYLKKKLLLPENLYERKFVLVDLLEVDN